MKTSRDWVVTFWLILLWTWVYKYFFEIKLSNYFLEGVYLEVKLHHIIILFLVFKETTVLLFTVVAGYTFPLTMHKGQRSVFFNPHWCQYLFPSFLSALLHSFLLSLFFSLSSIPFLPPFFSFIVATLIGEGNGDPVQYSCLENPMDGGAW